MARHYGWAAVAGPDAMDHEDFLIALQLLAEERYGKAVRAAKRSEDAKFAQAHRELGAVTPAPRPIVDARARSTRQHDL